MNDKEEFDPGNLERIMFEVKHNIVDIERFEFGIRNGEYDCEGNEGLWEEIDFLKSNLNHHMASPKVWSDCAYGTDYSRALYESQKILKILKPLFTGNADAPESITWGKWSSAYPY
jgi:hypothetical protein